MPAAARGDALLSPAVTRNVLAHLADPVGRRRHKTARTALDRLADREVAHAVATGGSNAEIGAELHLAEATVKAYLSRAMHKRRHQQGPDRTPGPRHRRLTKGGHAGQPGRGPRAAW